MAKHLKIQTCLNFLEADMWPENAEFIIYLRRRRK